MNELKITPKDWLGVTFVGVAFSSLLSTFGYYLLGLSIVSGAFFGVVLGLSIALFSSIFITFMNLYLLPKAPKALWNSIAAIFSFLSGFYGLIFSNFLLAQTNIVVVDMFLQQPYISASIIGIHTYLIGAVIYRLVKAKNEKEYLDQLLTQSRLGSLETQLNSHFLFNALNSLAELIHQDQNKAEATTLKISAFLRDTMREKPLITLKEELENTTRYIELENIRFNGSIALFIDVDNSFLSLSIPKFSIQLLCENGVKHGLRRDAANFTINIFGAAHNDNFIVKVSNNGYRVSNATFGIGLLNLQERLARLCQGGLKLENLENPTYTITLKKRHENINSRR